LSEHVQDIADQVVLMDYRDFAVGADGIIAHAENEVSYGDSIQKAVFIGVETQCGLDPEKQTFCEEGEDALDVELGLTVDHYASTDHPAFGGVAVHCYECYRALTVLKVEGGLDQYEPQVFFRGSPIHVRLEHVYPGEHSFAYLRWQDDDDDLEVDEQGEGDTWEALHEFTSHSPEFDRSLPVGIPIGLYRLEVEADGEKFRSRDFFVIFDPTGGLPEQDLANYWEDEKTAYRKLHPLFGFRLPVATSHHTGEVMICMAAASGGFYAPETEPVAWRNVADWIATHTTDEESRPPSDITDYLDAIKADGPLPNADCDGVSAFAVALGRAAGIPTRVIHGLGVGEPDGGRRAPGLNWQHDWTELFTTEVGWQAGDAAHGTTFATFPEFVEYHEERGLQRLAFVRDELYVNRKPDYR
jgi:hypothetical protein